MAAIASMTMLNAKCLTITPPPTNAPKPLPPPTTRPLALPKPFRIPTATAIAGAVFSALNSADAAFAAQQIADVAEGDSRGLALLLPLVPAIGWVLFNILRPALNQLDRMQSDKGLVIGLGIGGSLAAAGLVSAPSASAGELAAIADAAGSSSDGRGLLLLFVVVPAIGWVLFNILQPALNQLDRMKSG